MKRCPIPFSCGCGGDSFVLDGTRARKIRTPIGTVDIPALMRVKCPYCGRTRSCHGRSLRGQTL